MCWQRQLRDPSNPNGSRAVITSARMYFCILVKVLHCIAYFSFFFAKQLAVLLPNNEIIDTWLSDLWCCGAFHSCRDIQLSMQFLNFWASNTLTFSQF